MQLTKHFSLDEMTVSQTASRLGIENKCPPHLISTLIRTAEGLEDIRARVKCPIIVTSGYRSEALNKAIGGSENSQHVLAEAADIICPGFGSATALAILIGANIKELRVDQLILEFGRWVHVSFTAGPIRNNILTIASKEEGYVTGIRV